MVQQADKGYAILERVFTRTEMAQVLDALSTSNFDRTKAGARHILGLPVVRGMSRDPRMIASASQFIGDGAMPFRATLFDKSRDANWLVVWHQDTALPLRERTEEDGWGPWSTKAGVLYAHAPAWALQQIVALRVSLDDSTATNGPLRVLPQTHKMGVLADAEIQRIVREKTAVDCVAACGDVVAMCPLTVHASSKAVDDRPRRILHVEYAARMDLGSGIMLAVA